jgi:trans-aconitate methyltransferase
MSTPASANAEFDHYAAEYDAALQQGLAVSGESKEHFARGRIEYLAQCLRRIAPQQEYSHVLDYGCGTGSATPFLLEQLPAQQVLGVDVSGGSLEVARRDCQNLPARFATLDEYSPSAEIDLAFCNGVFHHIPPEERESAARYVFKSLRPGGLWAFWENNPWNPGTRLVMKRIAFDRDARTLSAPVARNLLRRAGFEIVRTDFLFIFPHALRALRPLEARVARLPLGAQYQVLCRKPSL